MIGQLSTREKNLAIVVSAIAFLFVNFFVIDYFRRNKTALAADLARQKTQLATMKQRFADKPKWEQRDAWLTATLPKAANDDTAGVQLLDRVKDLARKYDVTLEKPAIRIPTRRAEVTAISVDMDVKSSWKGLIQFLSELQQPDQFTVLERANLKIDNADQTRMHGVCTIAKWYAPK